MVKGRGTRAETAMTMDIEGPSNPFLAKREKEQNHATFWSYCGSESPFHPNMHVFVTRHDQPLARAHKQQGRIHFGSSQVRSRNIRWNDKNVHAEPVLTLKAPPPQTRTLGIRNVKPPMSPVTLPMKLTRAQGNPRNPF